MIQFVQPSATQENSPRIRREKRKGVHFDVNAKEDATILPIATSDFIHRSGWTWEAISKAFNCDDHPTDHDGLMEEILELCAWGTDEVAYKEPEDDDDSDDDEWMAAVRNGFHKHNGTAPTTTFAQGTSKLPAVAASSTVQVSVAVKKEVTVSSLRLNSLLRLDSHRFGTEKKKAEPRFVPSRSTSCSQDSSSSDSNGFHDGNIFDLEQAFKGIIEDDNTRSCDTAVDSQDINNGSQDDFWNQVEF